MRTENLVCIALQHLNAGWRFAAIEIDLSPHTYPTGSFTNDWSRCATSNVDLDVIVVFVFDESCLALWSRRLGRES